MARLDPFGTAAGVSGSSFNAFATAIGHSHPRFTDTEPSEPDKEDRRAHPRMDYFIVSLVDQETIELTLSPGKSANYWTETGPKALESLTRLGILAEETSASRLHTLGTALVFIAFTRFIALHNPLIDYADQIAFNAARETRLIARLDPASRAS